MACLKVGLAGPRNGTGLRGRLRLHFSSNPNNSVLARHLASDVTSRWSVRHDSTKRVERQAFLAERCYSQTSVVQDVSRRDFEMLEAALIDRLRPPAAGADAKRAGREPLDVRHRVRRPISVRCHA